MCVTEGQIVLDSGGGADFTCTAADILSDSKRTYLKSVIVPEMIKWVKATLPVRRSTGAISLSGPDCGTSAKYTCCRNTFGTGKKFNCMGDTSLSCEANDLPGGVDFVLHVTARPSTVSTRSWGLACSDVDDGTMRPALGQINFNPKVLVATSSTKFVHNFTGSAIFDAGVAQNKAQLRTAIHEVLHALGFSSSKYANFQVEVDGVLTGRGSVVRENILERGDATIAKLITPTVLEKVRGHFGCETANGAELEGGAGVSSHWEKRVFGNELMTGEATDDSSTEVISDITLAVFEDSGWYKPNYGGVVQEDGTVYGGAEKFAWGKDQGCEFLNGKCANWPSNYFCSLPPSSVASQGSFAGCSADYSSKSTCSTVDYASTSLPSLYQYFESEPTWAGSSAFMDYCPIWTPSADGNCMDIATTQATVYQTELAEEVGRYSRCVMGDAVRIGQVKPDSITQPTFAACHRIECERTILGQRTNAPGSAEWTVTIRFKGDASSVICAQSEEGQSKAPTDLRALAPSMSGTIVCPDAKAICESANFDTTGAYPTTTSTTAPTAAPTDGGGASTDTDAMESDGDSKTSTSTLEPEESRSSSTGLIIGVVGALVVVAGLAGFAVIKRKPMVSNPVCEQVVQMKNPMRNPSQVVQGQVMQVQGQVVQGQVMQGQVVQVQGQAQII
jgi:hypothetical protein